MHSAHFHSSGVSEISVDSKATNSLYEILHRLRVVRFSATLI